MTKLPSVLDLISQNEGKSETASVKEVAMINEKQQMLMEKAGSLTPVALRGPNGFINAYYSNAENAFFPKFETPAE